MPNTLLNTTRNRPHVTSLSVSSDKFGIPSVWPIVRRVGDGSVENRKKCSKCGKTKPVGEFYRSDENKGGRQSKCKSCSIEYDAAYSKSNRNRISETKRDYRARNRDRIAEYDRNRRLANPKKMKARNLIRTAKTNGTIVSCPCEVCGSTENVQAHHEDYDKPLEVRWLCASHHKLHHAELRRKNNGPE